MQSAPALDSAGCLRRRRLRQRLRDEEDEAQVRRRTQTLFHRLITTLKHWDVDPLWQQPAWKPPLAQIPSHNTWIWTNAQVVVRRAELAEQSREEEEMAARVESEVSRRVAEAIETEAIAARIQAKLKVTYSGSSSQWTSAYGKRMRKSSSEY